MEGGRSGGDAVKGEGSEGGRGAVKVEKGTLLFLYPMAV